MAEIVQHAIVTLVAFGAAVVLVRRVFVTMKPSKSGPSKCASCPAATGAAPVLSSEARPLTLVR
jgi:hypothetical protein